MNHALRRSLLFFVALGLLVQSVPAHAVPDALKTGTRRMWATLGLGPAIKMSNLTTQFKLQQTFGFHLFNNGMGTGPAIAFDLEESFGDGYVLITLGPRFVWDIQPIQGLGFYISPFGRLGVAISPGQNVCIPDPWSGGENCTKGDAQASFNFNFGVEGKLVLTDRFVVFFRPVSIDLNFRDYGEGVGKVAARFDILVGGGVTF